MNVKKKVYTLISALCLLGTFGYLSIELVRSDSSMAYETATVGRGDLELTIAASGKIKPKHTVEVGAQVSGQLENLLVEVGDEVEVGELLAEIDPTLAQARVDQSLAQVKELQALLAQQKARIDLAKAETNRFELLRLSSAISEAEYEISLANLSIAEAELLKLEAQLERQQSILNADVASLEYTKIYAPISGTVVELNVVEGQTLNSLQMAPTILRIANSTEVTVEAEISEVDVLHLEQDQSAKFTILGSERIWHTEVAKILPQPEILNDVVLYKAHLEVENPDNVLLSEMTAQVFFVEEQVNDALTVPIAALGENRRDLSRISNTNDRAQTRERSETRTTAPERRAAASKLREAIMAHPDATLSTVFQLSDGQIRPVNVLIGVKTRSSAEVLYGLQEGEEVLVGVKATDLQERNQGGQRATSGGRPQGPRLAS